MAKQINDSLLAELLDEQSSRLCVRGTKNLSGFHPQKSIPNKTQPAILADVNRSTTERETFLKLFPMELFEKRAFCTNMRF